MSFTFTDPYEDPFVIERMDGSEVASALDPDAAKDAARHLIGEGAADRLAIRARHSGAVQIAEPSRGPYGGVSIQGTQGSLGIAAGWVEEQAARRWR